MHPTIQYELARIKLNEQLRDAERQRQARSGGGPSPVALDLSQVVGRVRSRLLGSAGRSAPSTSEAGA